MPLHRPTLLLVLGFLLGLLFGLYVVSIQLKAIDNNAIWSEAHNNEVSRYISKKVQLADSRTWQTPELPKHLQEAEQNDGRLIQHIWDNWIILPDQQPLNLSQTNRVDFSQIGQSPYLDKVLNNKTGGFYVECGAFDGEGLSNTLYFELRRGWTGLLIEADPTLFRSVAAKHRDAYILHACLSPSTRASLLNFTTVPQYSYMSGLADHGKAIMDSLTRTNGEGLFEFLQIQCFPLYSVLSALGVHHIDLFSLDIEGAELGVLKTIPFDKVSIEMFLIEVKSPGEGETERKRKQIEDLLHPLGYITMDIPEGFVPLDMILYKP